MPCPTREFEVLSLNGLVTSPGGGEKAREPHRIPWSKVRDIGVDVDVDIDVRDTRIFAWQDWLRDKIIRHIPGA